MKKENIDNNYNNDKNNKKSNKNTLGLDKDSKIYFAVFVISIILVLICLFFIIFNLRKKNDIGKAKVSYYTGNTQDMEVVDKIRNDDAYKRIKVYLGKIIENIGSGNYEYAYSRLYSEFKDSYFPTLKSFEDYVTNYFPKDITYTYDNFEKIGEYYVVKADLVSISNTQDVNNRDDMYFVFKEYDFDDYVFSFSTITLDEDIQIEAIRNVK